MIPVPPSWQRLADEIDGWLDLRCPERALERVGPLLDDAAARPAALTMRIRAWARQGEYRSMLPDLAELRTMATRLEPEMQDWVDLTEGWCRKRLADLPGAIRCLTQLVARNPRSDIGHFNLGCYLALSGATDRAIDEVTLACGLGDACRDFARDEPDLDSLRTAPRFRQLLRETATGQPPADDDDDPPPAHGMN